MPEISLTQSDILAFAIGVSLLAGVVRGFTGFGGPAIMVLALTQFYTPVSVLALVLLVDYAANFQLAIGAIRHTRWRSVAPLAIGSIISLPLGIYALQVVDPLMMKRSIALVTGVCVCVMLCNWRYKREAGLAIASVVGLFGGVAVGATFIALPVMIFIFAGPSNATEARANAITWGLIVGAGLSVAYVWRDLVKFDDLWQVVLITLFYMGGAFIGARAFKKASEKLFRRVVLLSMLGLSIIGITT